uniref:Si:ch211-193l2.10 n=1 Tax=Sinocyclocheilus grahami TaxID=75366 RepID=A0A672K0T6_SINGR
MRNLLTTQDQNFYRELILKEAYTRLAWKMKYSKEYPTTFVSRRSRSIGLFNPPSVGKVTLPPVVQTWEKQPVRRSLSEAPLMRAASPQTKAALCQGLSNEGKGRGLYLRKRAQKDPEEKFDYPILSSWEYGWRLGEDSFCNIRIYIGFEKCLYYGLGLVMFLLLTKVAFV